MNERDDDADQPALGPVVPLFPLPNVVLFPRAILPLHIFEERYKAMTADAIGGRREIAMALLQPGWEKSYYGRPSIEPVVCVGRILSHEKLPDGKYNFLLQGTMRARIVREIAGDLAYRSAELEPLIETKALEIDLTESRARIVELLEGRLAGIGGIAKQFGHMLSSALPTAHIADLVAFNLLEDVALKQSLLAETDVKMRVKTIVASLEELPAPPIPAHAGDPNMN